jgi:hypothetical protein
MAFSEDLSVFFDTSEFAVDATVAGVAVKGIFDHQYVEEFDITGEAPTLLCQTSQLPSGLSQGDTVSIGSTQYQVVGIQPDGTGLTLLVLEYVSG